MPLLFSTDIKQLNEEFNRLEMEKKAFQIKVENFENETKKRQEEIENKLKKNEDILSAIAKKEEGLAKKQKELDNLLNKVYNKEQKKIISLYSKMKPDVIAEIFGKLVIEDIDKAVFIIKNIPEEQAVGTMMNLENSISTMLTQKLLKRNENAK